MEQFLGTLFHDFQSREGFSHERSVGYFNGVLLCLTSRLSHLYDWIICLRFYVEIL